MINVMMESCKLGLIYKEHIHTYVATNAYPSSLNWFLGRPAHGWFLKITSVQTSVCVFVCVCLPLRLLITSGVMWHDIDPMRLVKQVLQLLYGNCSHYR